MVFIGEKEISVDMNDEKEFTWQCTATSDPSTPPQVRWFKETKEGDLLVYDGPPALSLSNGTLRIHVVPNKTQGWEQYQGKYRCDGENGYTKESVYAVLKIVNYQPPGKSHHLKTIRSNINQSQFFIDSYFKQSSL